LIRRSDQDEERDIMIDPYTPVLAFMLGLLAGWFSQSWHAKRLWWRLKGVMPRRCQSCNRWYGSRANMHFVEHRAAGWIYICQDCYDEEYHPFTKETP
jgi:hypothetical protein